MSVTHPDTRHASTRHEACGCSGRSCPLDRDTDVIRLYVDPEDAAALDADKYEVGGTRAAQERNNAVAARSRGAARGRDGPPRPDRVAHGLPRRARASRVSFGTYFNAFPASYWRRCTRSSSEVRLDRPSCVGEGATVTVYRSMANGRSQRVDSATTEAGGSGGSFTFDLTLKPFVDGGWYWYDVVAGDEDAVVETAEWTAEVPADRAVHGTTVTIGITTMNRPDFCAKLLGQLGDADELDAVPRRALFVMEQGTDKVVDSEHYPKAAQGASGDTLRIVEQGNLGGSGGYARGQPEPVSRRAPRRTSLMMDDDVVCETGGHPARGHLRRPGPPPHDRGRPHVQPVLPLPACTRFGEIIQPWRFWWQTPTDGHKRLGPRGAQHPLGPLAAQAGRRRLQRLVLLPDPAGRARGGRPVAAAVPEVGRLRVRPAGQGGGLPHGHLPGRGVRHVPWVDKNDALDWQAYFHVRNRFVAALLHSTYPRGGRLIRENLNHTIAHLVSMQYSTVAIRHLALEDVLAGPDGLHAMLPTRLAEINAFRKEYLDAQLHEDLDDFPPVRRDKPPRKGRDISEVPSRLSRLITAGLAPVRHLKSARELSRSHPEVEVRAMDAKWYRLAAFDSAIVSMNDGTSAALYRRDPEQYRDQLEHTLEIHERLRREWPRLAREYRDKLGDVTSPEAWDRTFAPWTGGEQTEER